MGRYLHTSRRKLKTKFGFVNAAFVFQNEDFVLRIGLDIEKFPLGCNRSFPRTLLTLSWQKLKIEGRYGEADRDYEFYECI